MEAKSKGKLKPKTFTVKINIKFFDCASCCGSQIIGCYAPNGDHCERPLEIGKKLALIPCKSYLQELCPINEFQRPESGKYHGFTAGSSVVDY